MQQTNILIDLEVLAFLEKKNKKCLVLDITRSGGGCCPTYEVADISFKKPDDSSLYNTFFKDDIELYITNNAIIIAPVLRFSLERTGLMKQIVAKGIYLKSDQT
jgi:hypothetical protein